MKIISLFIVTIFSINVYGQSWQWAKPTTGGNKYNGCFPSNLRTDKSGDLYVGNFFVGDSISFGNYTLHTAGPLEFDTIHDNYMSIVTKYDSLGNVKWTNGNSWGSCSQFDIATDPAGNVYELITTYGDSVRFNDLYLPATYYDSVWFADFPSYLIKYNSNGSITWIKSIGQITIYGTTSLASVRTDNAGNIYIYAAFYDPSTVIGPYPISKVSVGLSAFIAKLDSDGNFLWIKQFDNSAVGYLGMTISSNNDIFLIGEDPLVIKMDTGGNTLSTIEKIATVAPVCVTTDKDGNLYVGGEILLQPGYTCKIGTYSFTTPFNADFVYAGILIKYNSSNEIEYVRCLLPGKEDSSSNYQTNYIGSVATDSCDNVWITGPIDPESGIWLDPSTIIYAPQKNSLPLFLAEYDDAGNLLDHQIIPNGQNSITNCTGLAIDDRNNIYLGGPISINPFALGNDVVSTSDIAQYFVAKYDPQIPCGLSTLNNGSDIIIFPNPTTASLTIIATHTISNVSIVDMLGQVLYSIDTNSEKIELNINWLANGMYFLRINHAEVRKFVKI